MTGARDGEGLIETNRRATSTGSPSCRRGGAALAAVVKTRPSSTPSAACRLNRTERFVGAARSGPSACKPRSTSVRGLSGCGWHERPGATLGETARADRYRAAR